MEKEIKKYSILMQRKGESISQQKRIFTCVKYCPLTLGVFICIFLRHYSGTYLYLTSYTIAATLLCDEMFQDPLTCIYLGKC